MDEAQIQELVTRAAWLLPLFGAAAAALLALLRKPAIIRKLISGEVAATIAGLLSGACAALGILDLLPQVVYVVAAVLIATPLPAVSYDLATRAGKATEFEAVMNEWDDMEANAAGDGEA